MKLGSESMKLNPMNSGSLIFINVETQLIFFIDDPQQIINLSNILVSCFDDLNVRTDIELGRKCDNYYLEELSIRDIDDGKTIREPYFMTQINQKNAIERLHKCYKKNNEINKVIDFIKKTAVGTYFYIFPFVNCLDKKGWYDIKQRYLSYYNKGMSSADINEKVKLELNEYHIFQKYLDSMKYKIFSFLPQTRKIYLGEPVKNKRKCRYCGKSMKDKGTTFKNLAHSIPESLGNKTYIQNEECDTCNQFFANYIEEDLSNFLLLKRRISKIKGKNGYPQLWLQSLTSEDLAKYKKIFDDSIASKKILKKAKGKNYYQPVNVYKALVKCVIGMIDKTYLCNFEDTIEWLKNKSKISKCDLPLVMRISVKKNYQEPVLDIYIRKDGIPFCLPYCYSALTVGTDSFIFIIPFSSADHLDFSKNEIFCIFYKYVLEKYYDIENNDLLDLSSYDEFPIMYDFSSISTLE